MLMKKALVLFFPSQSEDQFETLENDVSAAYDKHAAYGNMIKMVRKR